mmetsp:Transcript_51554/g.92724  ORF Transcript_51554/g.92724 Transcript_51554/m.92724 type:complete len:104 (-) Transcript_51554:318-629(-)
MREGPAHGNMSRMFRMSRMPSARPGGGLNRWISWYGDRLCHCHWYFRWISRYRDGRCHGYFWGWTAKVLMITRQVFHDLLSICYVLNCNDIFLHLDDFSPAPL